MKRLVTFVPVVTLFGLFFATEASAQRGVQWKGGGGWGPETTYARMYNAKTAEHISGEVVSVDRITPMKGMSYGIHARVKTAKETISVHLGPGWYIENQNVKLAPGDKIEVTGSRVVIEGTPALLAAEVRKGDEVLTLRDANGVPAWSGWRRRHS